MNAHPSSARLAFRKLIKIGSLLVVIGVLGVGLASVAAFFVLGDLSGAWQTRSTAANHRHTKGLIPVHYAVPGQTAPANPQPQSTDSVTPSVPAALVATPIAPERAVLPVARALPVLVEEVPVRRAAPVTIAAAPTYDVRAELADDTYIPRARPVPARELASGQGRPYALPANRRIAEREPVTVSW